MAHIFIFIYKKCGKGHKSTWCIVGMENQPITLNCGIQQDCHSICLLTVPTMHQVLCKPCFFAYFQDVLYE